MNTLFLLPSLDYNGAARQALMLGRACAASADVHVCALDGEGAWAPALRAAGVTVHSLNWTRALDPRPLWRLRSLVRGLQPDRIHVWRLAALRALGLAAPAFLPRCLVSQAMPRQRLRPRLGRLDRWLLQPVHRIVAAGAAERRQWLEFGMSSERVVVIPPGVEACAAAPRAHEGVGRRVVCVGRLEPNKGLLTAMWAADFLGYPFTELQLHIIGAGPYAARLQGYHRLAIFPDRKHLLGPRADAGDWLAQADVCWAPSATATGRQVALEAMAAGRPVVAADLPHFREIIEDGVTGLFFPAGDKMELARRTRRLLLDAELRRAMGESGRRRVREEFSAEVFVQKCRSSYGWSGRSIRQTPQTETIQSSSVTS